VTATHAEAAWTAEEDRVGLRHATQADCERIWLWNFAADVRARSKRAEVVSYLQHERWFARRLADGLAPIWVIEVSGEPTGVIRLDPANPGPANPGPANPGPANPGPANPGPAGPDDRAADHAGDRGRMRVSIALAASVRGRGVGRAAIALVCRRWRGPIVAEIFEDNLASRACFVACGFRPAGSADGLITYHWDPEI
jgi:L-amino acid N-acyltransferase YncA